MKQLLDIKSFLKKYDRLPTCDDCVFFDVLDRCTGECKKDTPIIFEKMITFRKNGFVDHDAMVSRQFYPIVYTGDMCSHGLFRDGWV